MIAFLGALSPSAIASSPRNVIRDFWDRVSRFPGGTRLFSSAVGLAAPYTSTIAAHVEVLRAGYAEVTLRDRRAVRNHLDCVHAVALCNLAELAGNVALAYSLPDDARFIVAGLSIEYLKKARGTIRAVVEAPVPETSARQEYDVPVRMLDHNGDVVARATLRTLVGPKKRAGNEA
jgi:acyl-coenzyme A thioesterase PaaI-like protein